MLLDDTRRRRAFLAKLLLPRIQYRLSRLRLATDSHVREAASALIAFLQPFHALMPALDASSSRSNSSSSHATPARSHLDSPHTTLTDTGTDTDGSHHRHRRAQVHRRRTDDDSDDDDEDPAVVRPGRIPIGAQSGHIDLLLEEPPLQPFTSAAQLQLSARSPRTPRVRSSVVRARKLTAGVSQTSSRRVSDAKAGGVDTPGITGSMPAVGWATGPRAGAPTGLDDPVYDMATGLGRLRQFAAMAARRGRIPSDAVVAKEMARHGEKTYRVRLGALQPSPCPNCPVDPV